MNRKLVLSIFAKNWKQEDEHLKSNLPKRNKQRKVGNSHYFDVILVYKIKQYLYTSTRKLLEIVEREHVALVIFGHDGQQWQMLKTVPAYYG